MGYGWVIVAIGTGIFVFAFWSGFKEFRAAQIELERAVLKLNQLKREIAAAAGDEEE